MNPFIILTNKKTDKEFHVNFNNILYYEEDKSISGSTIYLKGDKNNILEVTDTPDEIDIMIDDLFEEK